MVENTKQKTETSSTEIEEKKYIVVARTLDEARRKASIKLHKDIPDDVSYFKNTISQKSGMGKMGYMKFLVCFSHRYIWKGEGEEK